MTFKNLEMFLKVGKIQHNNYTTNQNLTLITHIFREFKKKNIKCNYNVHPNGNNHGKFILSTERHNYDTKDILAPICNGIIFDYHTMKPLCIPPIATISQYKSSDVNDNIIAEKYDIFKLVDGSLISLHWCPYNREWALSSSHGLNISNVRFNTMTYQEIFNDVISQIQYAKTGDPLLDFDPHKEDPFYRCLDKSMSYTFSITHPDLHPFQKNVGLTIICAVNVSQWPEVNYNWNPDEFNNLVKKQNHKILHYQERFTGHIDTDFSIQDIYYLSQTSISSYMTKQKLTKELDERVVEVLDTGAVVKKETSPNTERALEISKILQTEIYKDLTPFYGFVLRAKPEYTDEVGSLNNVLITSLLMTKLKELLYNSKFSQYLKKWEQVDRNKYIELYHFVNNDNNKQLYQQLFPGAYKNWLKMADLIGEIGENIVDRNALENIENEPNEYKKFIYNKAKQHFESNGDSSQILNFLRSKELVIAYYFLVHNTPLIETDSETSELENS
jgi:hypothetical protein